MTHNSFIFAIMKACKSYKKGGRVRLKMGVHKDKKKGGLTRAGVAKYNRTGVIT